ncbi:PREDICTED: uncharacterized protein LOC104608351 [Nelumbo nucifera]|uniref:Uncharacterized protein n=2 Tax=Nelumbo nucifera TaxID=4432 RepID=A0A822ZU27_NELNU|nr:PREDICTED: uncharacterized protein LOC104608351 [Nelumbo nucifera]DAD48070.1 TPA_asm: hypothetical protein HUJ06_018007 [Nelumbo nucifera]
MGCLISVSIFLPFNAVILLLQLSWYANAQAIDSARLLDYVVRDYAFQSYTARPKTGFLYNVRLPANLSGIGADTVRFRCGSLRRYGAQVKEFRLAMGVTIDPCVERVVVVRQNLGTNWSSIYYSNYNFSGYQLVSPILGLLAYNFADFNTSNRSEIGIFAGKRPITIDFSKVARIDTRGLRPLCASFDSQGKVSLSNQVSSNVCVASQHGHFGLVVVPSFPQMRRKVSRWKVVVGSLVGGALGAFLLSLLIIAMVVKAKKKSRMAEMERRAYEEEALQISMVGHVRAPTAAVTRTQPTLEHEYSPPS